MDQTVEPSRRITYFSQGRTAPLRLHSQTDIPKQKKRLTPIKLKTQNSKYIKTTNNHLPIYEELKMNVEDTLKKSYHLFIQRKFDQVILTLKPLLNTSRQVQCLYYIGCSFFYKSKYEHSIYYLNLVIEKDPSFNKNSFMILAAAYKQLHLPKVAIKILLKCLDYFKGNQEVIVYLSKQYIKIRQYQKALRLLEGKLRSNCLGTLRLTYADCLRLVGRLLGSIEHYNILCENPSLRLVGLMKRMTAYYELKEYELSLNDCNTMLSESVRSSEVHYFKGMIALKTKKQNDLEFPVDFYKSLDLNNHQLAVTRSLCQIVKHHINNKDIYSAELQMKRIQHLSIKSQQIKQLKMFVEGAIDCVKKRSSQAISKLTSVEKNLRSKTYQYSDVLYANIQIYLAYAYFLSSQYAKAGKYYAACKFTTPSSEYNYLICQGIVHSQNSDFSKCYQKINQAKSLLPHYQPYFYLGINYVQQHFSTNNQQFLDKAITELQAGTQHNPSSLYYFYLSLVLIHAKKPAEAMISIAIQKSDDNVADYYFVRGIVEADSDLSLALNDFTSAIEMLKIPAYYKQRSKCLYQLGMYSLAIEDLLKVLSVEEKDYEASILLAFNYYSNQEYLLSLNTLNQVAIEQQNQYLLGLKVALNVHLRNYKKAGTIGQLIQSMQFGVKISDQKILDKFQQILDQKYTVGEFDIVQLLCLGGAYHFVHGDYKESQICFYEALNQLKMQLTKNSSTIDFGTEAKIYQSKFNIALTHLMLKQHDECKKLIDILIQETESQQTVYQLVKFQKFLKEELDNEIKMSIDADEIIVDIFPNYKLLSQKFPYSKTRFKTAVLVLKPILFYPQKIKFNIFPQLNPKFLRQFGVWKIENTPEPPWVMRDGTSFKFTQELNMQGAVVEYTDSANDAQSSIQFTSRKQQDNYYDTSTIKKQQLKLPDNVNQKLQRLIKGQSKQKHI